MGYGIARQGGNSIPTVDYIGLEAALLGVLLPSKMLLAWCRYVRSGISAPASRTLLDCVYSSVGTRRYCIMTHRQAGWSQAA